MNGRTYKEWRDFVWGWVSGFLVGIGVTLTGVSFWRWF